MLSISSCSSILSSGSDSPHGCRLAASASSIMSSQDISAEKEESGRQKEIPPHVLLFVSGREIFPRRSFANFFLCVIDQKCVTCPALNQPLA